jgi:hypothetical protein
VTTFIDELHAGRATAVDIDDWIDRWHLDDTDEDLHEWLGLTWPEYAKYVETNALPTKADREEEMQDVVLQGGQKLWAHGAGVCERPCAIHWPREHHMRHWPQNWRPDRKIIERLCPHGIGHPDPDDRTRDTTHGCDGCCLIRSE